MLAVLGVEGARLDAGSVGLVLARRWSEAGERVLFVDADTSGSRLAQRFGEAVRAEYSPALRGMPSLIVARERLTVRLLADHCYSLDTSTGSLWALFAPDHPVGAEHAAGWLAGRVDELAAVNAQRSVVMSSSLPAGAQRLAPVLLAGAVVVVVAPVASMEQAQGLWTLCRDLGLSGRRCPYRALIVEGDSALSDENIGIETGMHVAGRLPIVDDERILRVQAGRRERAFASSLEQIANRLLAFSQHVASEARAAAVADLPAAARHALAGPPPRTGVNGAGTVPGSAAGEAALASRDRSV